MSCPVTKSEIRRVERCCKTALPGYDPWRDKGNCTFNAQRAAVFVDFLQRACRHIKGELAGQHIKLHDWETAIVGNLFGWLRPDGTRRYRKAFIFVPRKNGKTTLVACLVIAVFFGDGEPGAECYAAAADRDQAALLFDVVSGMVQQEPELARQVKIYRREIQMQSSRLKVLSSEAATKHGLNSHLVVIDELHAHRDGELAEVLKTSQGSRRQPLLIYTTTSDYERVSVCNDEHKYASAVRDGVAEDPTYLPVIFEATPEDDWTSPDTWAKANPTYPISPKQEFLAQECSEALAIPSKQNGFKRLYLNIRTAQDVKWLSMEAWRECTHGIDPADLAGRPCYVGLDLAQIEDIAAAALLFDVSDLVPDCVAVLPLFWIPGDNIAARVKRGRVPYDVWAERGYIKTTPGATISYPTIEADLAALADTYDVRSVRADQWNAKHTADNLEQLYGYQVTLTGQHMRDLNSPSKTLEKLVADRKLEHFANPVLEWMAGNAAVDIDNYQNIRPSKNKSPEKIDGIIATILGLADLELALGDDSGPEVHFV